MKRILSYCLLIVISLTSCSLPKGGKTTSSTQVSIHDIQGCSHVSPYEGRQVEQVEGVVTWKKSNGFFMQETQPDDKDCSSEGIFVFTDSYPEVIPGDLVSVDGRVAEFTPGDEEDYNLSITEIEADQTRTISEDNNFPEAVAIGQGGRLPPDKVIEDDALSDFDVENDGIDFYESLEGMRVEIENPLVVEGTNSYDEIVVIPQELAASNKISRDGALLQSESDSNPERLIVGLQRGTKITSLDQFSGPIIGIMDYEYGNYRLIQVNKPSIHSSERSTDENIELSENQISLATYNINNFNRFEEDKLIVIASQIVEQLGLPDILVLQEVQDDSGLDDDGVTSAEKNLNALIGEIYDQSDVMYRFIDPPVKNNSTGGAAGGNIRTAILYRTDRGLTLVESTISGLSMEDTVFNGSRRPIIHKFDCAGNSFYVIGVHFVSNNLNTPLFGSIQPPQKTEQEKRIRQAQRVAEAVRLIQAQEPLAGIFVLGDFNDVYWSDSLNVFYDAGLNYPISMLPESERYSILYEGNANLFDQILVSESWLSFIQTVWIPHFNTSEVKEDQVSDHDPYLMVLEL